MVGSVKDRNPDVFDPSYVSVAESGDRHVAAVTLTLTVPLTVVDLSVTAIAPIVAGSLATSHREHSHWSIHV